MDTDKSLSNAPLFHTDPLRQVQLHLARVVTQTDAAPGQGVKPPLEISEQLAALRAVHPRLSGSDGGPLLRHLLYKTKTHT